MPTGRAWNATGSDIQVRIGGHTRLSGKHASAHPAHSSHSRHALGLRLSMIEDELPLVKIVATLVDLDTPFFDLASNTRNAAHHAGSRTLPLLPPVSLESGQSTGTRLRQHVAYEVCSLTTGALLTEPHRLAPAAGESLLLSSPLTGAGLVEARSSGSGLPALAAVRR